MATCEQCGTVYEARRADSRYCGGPCRAAAARLSAREAQEMLSARADPRALIPGFGTPTCQCKMCQASASPTTINHGLIMDAQHLHDNGFNRNRVR